MFVAEHPLSCTCLAGLHILVVDDNADTLELVSLQLHLYGAEVVTASSAAEAFQLLIHDPPDVLVSDIQMPGEDGYSFLRRVRAQSAEHGGETPALAFTGYTSLYDQVKSRAAGFQAQLAKPVDPEDLVAAVASLAGRASV